MPGDILYGDVGMYDADRLAGSLPHDADELAVYRDKIRRKQAIEREGILRWLSQRGGYPVDTDVGFLNMPQAILPNTGVPAQTGNFDEDWVRRSDKAMAPGVIAQLKRNELARKTKAQESLSPRERAEVDAFEAKRRWHLDISKDDGMNAMARHRNTL